ncbi:MAG: helix-turn-helix domain-containing protein [Planctomycetota bacterium]|nr:helix-turn-helix domain-containing protein [Planctomycetota bacterium]
MKKELFAGLCESIRQMGAIRRGELAPGRVFRSPNAAPVDVKATRRKLKLSQAAFAALLGVPTGTLQGWEQGRRRPDGPARALLCVAARRPDAVLEALHPHSVKAKAG